MRMRLVSTVAALAIGLALTSGVQAQNAPPAKATPKKAADDSATPYKPAHLSDGAPDFSGVWEPHMPRSAGAWGGYSITGEIPPMTEYGKAQYLATRPSFGPKGVEDSTDPVNPTDTKSVGCAPTGVPRIWVHPFPMEIVQTPGRVILLYEFSHLVRQIYIITKGPHEHAKDLDPSWMGDSIGWWEGDTLVIDSTAFNDQTWVDRGGLTHSDQLHVIERISRPKKDLLDVKITVDDPKTYLHTWQGERFLEFEPDWKLVEMICEDNATFNDLKKAGKEQ